MALSIYEEEVQGSMKDGFRVFMSGFKATGTSREPKLTQRSCHKEEVREHSAQVVEGGEYHLCLVCNSDV